MDPIASRQQAQRRADRIRAFRAELEQLAREGAVELSAEQQQKLDQHLEATLRGLAARFDIDSTDREKQMSWGMRIASTIGALALCAAVVLFFYRFWGAIPAPTQVALLMAAPVAGLFAAEWMSRRESGLYFTGLIGAVAFAAFVLDLNVLGAIFNLTPTPNALLAWALFAGALAYRFGLRLLMVAALVCGMLWTAGTLLALGGAWWGEMAERPETVAIAGLAAAVCPRRAGFASTHRLVGLLAVYIAVLALSFTGASFLPLDKSTMEKLYQVAGLAVSAAAIWLGIRRGWSETVNASAAAFVIYLYIRLFDWWWDWMPHYLFFFVIGLIAIGLLVLFRGLRARVQEAA